MRRKKRKGLSTAHRKMTTEALLCSNRLQHAGVWCAQQLQTAWRGGQSAWLLQRGGGASPASALHVLLPAQGLHLRSTHHVQCRHRRHQRRCASLRWTEVASRFLMSHPPPPPAPSQLESPPLDQVESCPLGQVRPSQLESPPLDQVEWYPLGRVVQTASSGPSKFQWHLDIVDLGQKTLLECSFRLIFQ